jgi:hypothetical protein
MKQALTLSIEIEDVNTIRDFCEKTGMPMSRLFQEYASAMAKTIRAVGADKKVKLTKMDVIRVFGKGLAIVP